MMFADGVEVEEKERTYLGKRGITLFTSHRLQESERSLAEKCSLVRWLYLSSNKLTTFSAEAGTFPKLEVLDLSSNQLTTFSAERGAFPKLEALYLSNNQFSSFIVEEGAFPNLKILYFYNNPNLEVLEVSAPNLESLWIRNTKIRFLDKSLIGKVRDRNDIEVYLHPLGTKKLVTEAFHKGNPIVEEIVAHLTR